jgi:hypothetical protein
MDDFGYFISFMVDKLRPAFHSLFLPALSAGDNKDMLISNSPPLLLLNPGKKRDIHARNFMYRRDGACGRMTGWSDFSRAAVPHRSMFEVQGKGSVGQRGGQ